MTVMLRREQAHSARMVAVAVVVSLASALFPCMCFGGDRQDQKVVHRITGNARVDKLLSEMTLDEKISLVHGEPEPEATYQGQAGYMAGVPRLGIP